MTVLKIYENHHKNIRDEFPFLIELRNEGLEFCWLNSPTQVFSWDFLKF